MTINDPHHEPVAAPSDGTTLTDVVDSYRANGFAGDFFAEADASVRCGSCSTLIAASRLAMQSLRRLEGASDPADMVTVVATSCPTCGADGTLVLAYGPMASEDDAAVSAALRDLRQSDDRLPANAAPNEAAGSARGAHDPEGEQD